MVKRRLAVELATFNINAILADGHAQVLHGEHSASLAATLAATTITRSLDAKIVVLGLASAVLSALRTAWGSSSRRPSGTAHRVVTCSV